MCFGLHDILEISTLCSGLFPRFSLVFLVISYDISHKFSSRTHYSFPSTKKPKTKGG